MEDVSNLDIKTIIDSLADGVYACDPDRRIVYWSKSAERITGWNAQDVVGRRCFDNILRHVDKDGHRLCGKEYCPLHRAIVTATRSKGSLLVYARGKDGRRIPMLVSVAPIRNAAGQVIGGVETFRDASAMVHDLERAKAIQQLALEHDVPEDARVKFTTHYVPHDVVGGDYYAIAKLGDDRYGLMLADVMGHGIAAALYTMHLSQLWDRFHGLLANPAEFTATVNNELVKVVKTDGSFATMVCGVVDLEDRVFAQSRRKADGFPRPGRRVTGRLHERLVVFVGHEEQVDPERVDGAAMSRALIRRPFVRPHQELTAWHGRHPFDLQADALPPVAVREPLLEPGEEVVNPG
ncbi:MAG: PAS domain-containing protein [Planctomycetes bacterium]|nr:PAS domain-containing protein [Planctomycetota bacterium]